MGSEDDKPAGRQPKSSRAAARLTQVKSHLPPNSSSTVSSSTTQSPPVRRRRRSAKDDLPADYSDILSTLSSLRTLASTPPLTNPGYIRQKQAGKLWVRERVDRLLDPGTFVEVGSVSGTVTWSSAAPSSITDSNGRPPAEEPVSFTPSNNVQGLGRISSRKIVFTADDFSLRAGHADGAMAEKTLYIERLALAMRIPIIKLVDGSSGGGSVTTIKTAGYSYIPPMPTFKYVVKQLNAGIPNIGLILGPAIGLGAARAVACHFSVMAGDIGALFNAGPKVVAGATFEEGLTFRDLGGPDVHCRNGTVDNWAADEEECFHQVRKVIRYLPNSGASLPPIEECVDSADREDLSLRSIVPRKKGRMYDAKRIITTVLDQESWFEIGALWGTCAIVGLGRLDGFVVGIVSLNCEVNAGALDAAGSQKINRHLKFCDIFNIPVLQFVDVPGYAVGTVAERTATMRHGVALATTYYATTIPIFSVITRRVYGVAGGIMLDAREPRMRVSWPSGEWGSLPLDGGIEAGHAAELKTAKREGRFEERYNELQQEYLRLMNPIRTANAFGIEEIIDPKDTRRIACAWLKHVYEELLPQRLLDRANGKIHPQFY